MRKTTFTNDMTMMYLMHDALRRELRHISRITAEAGDDPAQILRAALGWEMFKDYLHVHHGAEDDVLWPAIREAAAGKQDELALLDAMEAEHGFIDPGLAAVDAALADRESGPQQLAETVDRLTTGVTAHLEHEEDEALDVVDAFATQEVLQRFGFDHRRRIGNGAPRFMPWMLEDASPEDAAVALAPLPPPVRQAYADEWAPAFAALDRWGVRAD